MTFNCWVMTDSVKMTISLESDHGNRGKSDLTERACNWKVISKVELGRRKRQSKVKLSFNAPSSPPSWNRSKRPPRRVVDLEKESESETALT